ncbi:hypothetical protein HR45_02690 [Shewanella mangrovi]|uniref:THIF-type NAD/FAD binding fold domain-containing protein n=1 Tax=Shewanella mangrovi TaxID=1515746 RepID=A0A094K165_9GAMM|nr:HesA/MoeB/ThiF family protein [Shewanella mangrovi]KFZ38371.1 hypothetical protein HR45_02690 [Shewanella mangrovi]
MRTKQNALSDRQFIRYSKQIMLPAYGERGQLNLLNSHVVIVGLGGLGQQAAQLLAAAGVGQLTLIDPDKVALDNLPRQTLYRDSHIAQAKVLVAARKLRQRYNEVAINTIVGAFDESKAHCLRDADLVLDCSDNFACRHALSRVTFAQTTALLSAAISAEQAWLALFVAEDVAEAGCLHCVFPTGTKTAQSCASQGVMGSAVATVASLQAELALRHLSGQPNHLFGQLLHIDFTHWRFNKLRRSRDPVCNNCATALRKCS